MPLMELKFLVLAQIAIDIIVVFVFIFLIRKFRDFNKDNSFNKPAKIFESLLTDADKMAGQFKEQLEEKHHLIKKLNKELDRRIISINILLNRADILLSHGKEAAGADDKPASLDTQQTEIIKLAKQGHRLEKIADMLSIPKGEVKLVLDLNKKFSRMLSKESVS